MRVLEVIDDDGDGGRGDGDMSCVVSVLRELALDGVVMISVPRLHDRLCFFLERLDSNSFQVHTHTHTHTTYQQWSCT